MSRILPITHYLLPITYPLPMIQRSRKETKKGETINDSPFLYSFENGLPKIIDSNES